MEHHFAAMPDDDSRPLHLPIPFRMFRRKSSAKFSPPIVENEGMPLSVRKKKAFEKCNAG